MKRKGREGECRKQVGPVLPCLGGCLGGDTPVRLSGRGCHRADVSVRERECV